MASKRRIKRRQCNGKKAYSKDDAIAAATRMRRQHPGQSFDGYACSTCGAWHVGHRPYKVQQQIAANRENRRKNA